MPVRIATAAGASSPRISFSSVVLPMPFADQTQSCRRAGSGEAVQILHLSFVAEGFVGDRSPPPEAVLLADCAPLVISSFTRRRL